MPTLARSFRRVVSRVVAVAGLSLAAVAADVSSAAAQFEKLFTEEVSNHRLTVAGMQKFMAATQALHELDDADLQVAERFENLDEDEVNLDQIAAAFDSEPRVKTTINGAGFSSREYVTFMFSMIQTMITAAMLEIGGENALAQMENSVLKQNVQFYREHQAEFEAMGEAMEAMGEDEDEENEEESEEEN